MWPWRSSRIAWQNPCGAITLTPEVRDQYQAAFDDLQGQWYETWPDVDLDPKWYARPNPEAAQGYPPGFLKRDLRVFVVYTASAPDTDGYFWASERFVTGVDSYEALEAALRELPAPLDMLIVSGECLNLPGDACGVCWREHNEIGFDSRMPEATAALIRATLAPTGLFVLGSCHAGNNPALVQEMADRIGRAVAGARDVCRGVRSELLEEDGIYWTLGGFAEGRAWTLAEPRGLSG
jgi:hypothetical protein